MTRNVLFLFIAISISAGCSQEAARPPLASNTSRERDAKTEVSMVSSLEEEWASIHEAALEAEEKSFRKVAEGESDRPEELPSAVARGMSEVPGLKTGPKGVPNLGPTSKATPLSQSLKNGSVVLHRVYFGTNRMVDPNVDPSKQPNEFFLGKSGPLGFGYCDVSIPPRHQYGEIERPQVWRFEIQQDANKHITIKQIELTSKEGFVASLQHDVNRSAAREAFVFVHGFNVSFAEAAWRTAQMAHDLKFDGPPLMFSWPSRGDITNYFADETVARRSEGALHSFLELVTRTSGASKVHLIAHSMGARLATDVMEKLSLQTAGQGPWFNQVILAAPDIDAKTFRDEIAPKVTSVAGRITVYASEKDRALQLSGFLHKDYRLGYGGSRLTVFPQIGLIDSIDASLVDFHFFELGHSHYGRELLTDIRQVLNGVPAPSRGLQPHARKPGWLIPTEAIAAVRPSEPERKPSGVKAAPVSQSAAPDRKNKTPATTTRGSRN